MCASWRALATGCAMRCPSTSSASDARGHYRGQKQIWFLLRLMGRDCDLDLRATDHPEFDAWRWNEYWVPLELVIEFKRDVYQMALSELARFLPRREPPQPLPARRHAHRATRTKAERGNCRGEADNLPPPHACEAPAGRRRRLARSRQAPPSPLQPDPTQLSRGTGFRRWRALQAALGTSAAPRQRAVHRTHDPPRPP